LEDRLLAKAGGCANVSFQICGKFRSSFNSSPFQENDQAIPFHFNFEGFDRPGKRSEDFLAIKSVGGLKYECK
jgi:hypothetical protein